MRALFALFMFPVICCAADRLNGTWRSDRDASMHFAKTHALLEPRQVDFLDGSLGRLELTFNGTTMRYLLPDFDLTIQGKMKHLVGTDETFSYRVLGTDDDSIALLVAKDHGRDRIIHIHFVNANTFWLYSEESDYGLRDLNYREYFRKIE
jgi:hypothetical protein